MSDIIRRADAIVAVENNSYGMGSRASVKAIKSLPSAEAEPPVLTCDGCKHVGTYDTDFPCSGCIRREKDYYEQER